MLYMYTKTASRYTTLVQVQHGIWMCSTAWSYLEEVQLYLTVSICVKVLKGFCRDRHNEYQKQSKHQQRCNQL